MTTTTDNAHTMEELYDYRRAYNALIFNEWAAQGRYDVHKSWRHSDGELCFGGGWFIVCATTPQGLVTNHYAAEHWGLFNVPEREIPVEYDGHTPQDALQRLLATAAVESLSQGVQYQAQVLIGDQWQKIPYPQEWFSRNNAQEQIDSLRRKYPDGQFRIVAANFWEVPEE